jgi:hypothetical protein
MNKVQATVKVKQSHNTPMKPQGGEDVKLLLIHDLGTRWEWLRSHTGSALPPGKGTLVPIGQVAA